MEENPDDKWFFSFSEEKEKWVLIKKLSTGIAYVNESGADFAVKDSKALVIVDAYNALTTTPIRELNDLASCQDLSDQAIVYSLERRLEGKLIYTYVGDIIIAMNPFVRLPILYTEDAVQSYVGKARNFYEGGQDLPDPHVFYTTDNAMYQLSVTGKSQSIIISGESGAGKTEAAKEVLHFLGSICGGDKKPGAQSFQDLILQSQPLLEAFGNAKTKRNDNSSRFGKYCTVYLDSNSKICGSVNIPYLLEKSRVCFQDKGERNFHSFYQLTFGDTAAIRKFRISYGMGDGSPVDANLYEYMNQSGCTRLEKKSDPNDYVETEDAATALGMDMNVAWTCLAAILQIGNMKFYTKAGAVATNQADIVHIDSKQCPATANVMRLLGWTEVQFNTGVCCKIFQGQALGLKLSSCLFNASTFAKFLYDKLFLWIVNGVNSSIMEKSGGRESPNAIGILDIFGFEKFDKNSLEQLCINFTNERLQNQFNMTIFGQEKAIYAAEQLDTKKLEASFTVIERLIGHNYAACQTIGGDEKVAIAKSPNCILNLLNEQSKVASENPEKQAKAFIESVFKAHTDGKVPYKGKIVTGDTKSEHRFIVDHYAGKIAYHVGDFVEKDRDALAPDLATMVKVSTSTILQMLFVDDLKDMAAPKGDPRKSIAAAPKQGIAVKFNQQLRKLIDDLNATGSHYIRCIKSNEDKAPCKVTWPEVMRQLMYAGVQQVVSIRKFGFQYKIYYETWVNRYHGILAAHVMETKGVDSLQVFSSLRGECEAVIRHMGFTDIDVLFGINRVFYRADQHRIIEGKLRVAQSFFKAKLVRLNWLSTWRRNCFFFTAAINQLKAALDDVNLHCGSAATLQQYITKIQAAVALTFKLNMNANFPLARSKLEVIDMVVYMKRELLKDLVNRANVLMAQLHETLQIQTKIEECLAIPDPGGFYPGQVVYKQILDLIAEAQNNSSFDETKNTVSIPACRARIAPLIKFAEFARRAHKITKWGQTVSLFTAVSKQVKLSMQAVNLQCGSAAQLQGFIDGINVAVSFSKKLKMEGLFPLARLQFSFIDLILYEKRKILIELIEQALALLVPVEETLLIQVAFEECLNAPDPEPVYQRVLDLIKQVHDNPIFNASTNSTLAACKTKIQPVIQKIKAEKEFELSLSQGDETAIKKALEIADANPYVKAKLDANIKSANAQLAKIEQEKKLIAKLDNLLSSGGWLGGSVQNLPVFKDLAACLNELKSWPGGVSGRKTKQQMFLAEMTLGVRQSLIRALPSTHESDWEPVGIYFEQMLTIIREKKNEVESEVRAVAELSDADKAAAQEFKTSGKTREQYLREDITFIEGISSMPEFTKAYEKYQEFSVCSKVRNALRAASDSTDAGEMEKNIKWAESVGMNEAKEASLAQAKSALKTLREVARKCQNALLTNQSIAQSTGVTPEHIAELKKVYDTICVQQPALKDIADVNRIVLELKHYEDEKTYATSVGVQMGTGAWSSPNVILGKFDTYDDYPAHLQDGLEGAVAAANKFSMKTVPSRTILRMASSLLELRRGLAEFIRLVKAEPKPYWDFWTKLGSRLVVLRSELKSVSVGGAALEAELAVFEKELAYQQQAEGINSSLLVAEQARDQMQLKTLLAQAKQLGLQAQYCPAITKSELLFQRILELNQVLRTAAATYQISAIDEAIATANDLKVFTPEITLCQKYRGALLALDQAERGFVESTLVAALEECKNCEIPAEAAPVIKAQGILSRVVECRELATVVVGAAFESIKGEGVTEAQITGLRQVMEVAAGVGGQLHVPAVKHAAELLQSMKNEISAGALLEDACIKGAWVNAGVACGDYDRYQLGSTIEILPLKEAIASARGALRTKKARTGIIYAESVVGVREILISVLTNPAHLDNWAPIAQAMESKFVTAVESKMCFPELIALRRELAFVFQARMILEELTAYQADHLQLRITIAKAELLGMTPKYFPLLGESQVISLKLSRLEQAIAKAEEAELTAALEDLKSAKVADETPLISRAQTLFDRLSDCRARAQAAVDAFEHASSLHGTSLKHQVALNQALSSARELNFQNADIILKVVALLDQLHQLAFALEELKIAVTTGAWLNQGVLVGDRKHYQSTATIDTSVLSTTFAQACELNIHTTEGRIYMGFIQALIPLREVLVVALNTASYRPSVWLPVNEALAHSGIVTFEQFYVSPELLAIRREVAHVQALDRLAKEMLGAGANMSKLVTVVQSADALLMNEADFPELFSARQVLATLDQLNDAVETCDEKKILSVLNTCKNLRIDPSASALVRAEAMLQRLNLCRECAIIALERMEKVSSTTGASEEDIAHFRLSVYQILASGVAVSPIEEISKVESQSYTTI